jgi:hypothetical protein
MKQLIVTHNSVQDIQIVGSMLICKKCSEKLIPGKTCTFKIEKSRNKKYRNCVAYTCSTCSTITRISGTEKIAKKQEATPRTPKLTLTPADIQKIVHSIPSHFRTLETPSPKVSAALRGSSESKQIEKKDLLESFFSSKGGNNLYSLFH